MSVPNYFASGVDAERYSRSRPYVHLAAIEKLRYIAGNLAPFLCALDVGCGTGQSTMALTEIASSIIGIDPSADMLAYAGRHPKIQYLQASAERIPFSDESFNLITAGQAFHWFDHLAFFAESSRLLRRAGWLTIYNCWFTSEMKEDMNFSNWFVTEYLAKFPTPPRNRTHITNELVQSFGFVLRGEDEFSNSISMTIERFVDYQLSTTNVIAAVKQGKVTFVGAANWLQASISPFFANKGERTFLFQGKIWSIEKVDKF